MLKKHKKALIASSLVTLLPIVVGLLLWNQLPEKFDTHWGISGQADGWSNKPFGIIAMPLILLAAHWFCVLVTAMDKKNQNQSKKVFGIVLWILPVTSNLCCYLMYALALGLEFSPALFTFLFMGLLFLVIGNYLPKCRMNKTIGIKVPWAYSSEENWNATHRFGGKVWVIGGMLILLCSLLPEAIGIVVMFLATIALCVIPIVYSYRYYRMQKARGEAVSLPSAASNPKVFKWSMVFVAVIFLGTGFLLFSGDVEVQYGEDSFTIEASYWEDLTVDYAAVEAIEYRDENVDGIRAYGVGSFRLLLGLFQNEEFGTYTRYTYYKPEACVVLTVDERTLVLSGETAVETEAIYQELLARIN